MKFLTEQDREELRQVIRRYAEWEAAHDGPLFETVGRIVSRHVSDAITDLLHPEFGTIWREGDGEAWLAAEQAKQDIIKRIERMAREPARVRMPSELRELINDTDKKARL